MSKTLRVAFYPLAGFFEYDNSGNEVGYGVELLDKISKYSGINFTYVKADSWENTKPMLLDDLADVRMPGSMPITPSTTLSYGDSSVIDTYHVILAPNSRTDLFYNDYDTIKKLKMAICDSFYTSTMVKEYLDKIGITEENLVFCSEYNQCRAMLDNGEVDAVITNVMDKDSSLKMLARFNNMSNYISMTYGNPYLETIDDALAQIKLDEPLFMSNLYQKWFPDRTVVPLTIEEDRYISEINSLTFAFRSNEGYLQRYENGQFLGIYVEQAKKICEKLGVEFKAVSMEDCFDGLAYADAYAGFFYDKNYADKMNYCISSPVDDINYYMIQKKDYIVDEKSCKIAAVEKFQYTKDYLQKEYKPEQFVYCDSYEECFQAIESGDADVAIINNYIAEYYLEKYQYSDLTARLVTEYSHLYCFAAAERNDILASVMTKELSSISNDEMKLIYIKGTEVKPDNNPLLAIIFKNPILFAVVMVVMVIILLAFIMLSLFMSKSKKQNAELTRALSAKSEFLARMSHDMRTPLNAVLGFAEIADDELNNRETVKSSINKIKSSGQYLLGLINDVLDASKLESDKIELHPEIVEGKVFLNEIAEEFETLAREKNITLDIMLDKANTPYVKLDRLRTRQIYTNLLNNALKFSNPGSRVEWYMEDTFLDSKHMKFVTTITDYGRGMSKEFMKHMFEPFTQELLNGQTQCEGTGLGLMIVKRFVELSGGTIEVESEIGKGTKFTIHMEREIPTEEEIAEFKRKKNGISLNSSELNGKRVLLCEDHPLNREIAVRILKKVGIQTVCAENGKLGADAFADNPPNYFDAILMDIRMPVMDGIETTKAIRAMTKADAASIPIIAMTANAYDEDIKKSLEAGMNAHLAKPVEPEKLYRILMKYIAKKNVFDAGDLNGNN